jgi:tRNA-splicing ligase RtcB (3'-phosphate/5'-hydroxy nucleic acid ligase)
MKYVITTEQKPIKLWLNDIEEGALEQAKNLANLPFVFKHIAIMPDSHQGYGMPIGAVMATRKVVVPNAVGVDIGCGMCAVKTSLTSLDQNTLKKIMGGSKEFKGGIRSKVPVGFSHRSKKQDDWLTDEQKGDLWGWSIIEKEYNSSLKQIGSLGGGNHFIEIQQGSDGFVWLMIHSGSRNIGFKVANHYNKLAVELNGRWITAVPLKWQLAFLPLDSEEGQNYMKEMQHCVDFAFGSRKLMMESVKACITDVVGDVEFDEMINVSHNHAIMEHHFNKNVMVHRKGATKAYKGQLGIIPGSQGTASYIVSGKGEPESFMSCSHGAGRKMGRKEAQRSLDLETEKKMLDEMGVIHALRNKKDLDEAPGSYKDIATVMDNQQDLVDIVVELKPLAVIKG